MALLSWLVYVKPVNIKAMVKVCNDYYMIDALAGGEVIRKRKYRRENTMIGYKWYDYNGVEVTDPIEISRLDGLATKHQRVDEAYDDHAVFMSSTNYVNSVSGIPMDKHMVVVEWRPDSEQGFVTMAHDEGLDGDSYYIVIINTGDKQATIHTPVDPEDPKDGTSRAVDGDNVSVGGSYVSMSPKQVERIRATFRDGKWYYELVTKAIVKMEADIEQCLYITLANKPTESTISYTKDREVINFVPGAIARWIDADGNNVFYKLVEIVGGKAKWIILIDTKYGNVTLQSTYDKNYEIVNIVSGSRLQAINSEKNDIKFVNSATGNVTVVLNGTVSGGAKKLTSLLAVNEVVLTPGAAVSFTRNGDEFVLTELFGVTIFPDLADANREGEWVMSVGITGKPILMEVKEMRKWDEGITKELTIDELNEKFPNVDIGFAVVCKTINKVYEMVNGYKEWVSYDITSIS